MKSIALALLMAASCPKPAPPIDPAMLPAPACTLGGDKPVTEGVCRDMFTDTGWPCALCWQQGCTDIRADVLVYCARGCGDPLCKLKY